jgi:hypothetical protein
MTGLPLPRATPRSPVTRDPMDAFSTFDVMPLMPDIGRAVPVPLARLPNDGDGGRRRHKLRSGRGRWWVWVDRSDDAPGHEQQREAGGGSCPIMHRIVSKNEVRCHRALIRASSALRHLRSGAFGQMRTDHELRNGAEFAGGIMSVGAPPNANLVRRVWWRVC